MAPGKEQFKEFCAFCGYAVADPLAMIEGLVEGVFICAACVDIFHSSRTHLQAEEAKSRAASDTDGAGGQQAAPAPVWPLSPRSSVVDDFQHWGAAITALLDKAKTKDKADAAPAPPAALDLPSPREIVAHLDRHVVGQTEAKRSLAVAVYEHYLRLNSLDADTAPRLGKRNVLMLGPSGCGKTLLVQTVARQLQVPYAECDATRLTQAGYFGEDVEGMLTSLLHAADMDADKAARGIVFIDEIDKIGSDPLWHSVGGEGVQQNLLKMIEGNVMRVSPDGNRISGRDKPVAVDTTHVLFVCGGVFDGLTDLVARRVNESRRLGFDLSGQGRAGPADARERELQRAEAETLRRARLLRQVRAEDLVRFGFLTEFVGRIPVHVALDGLDRGALRRILLEPEHSLVRQAQWRFALWDVELEITNGALDAIAEQAFAAGTGARGLESVMDGLLRDLVFELPDRKDVDRVVLNRNCVVRGHRPRLVSAAPST